VRALFFRGSVQGPAPVAGCRFSPSGCLVEVMPRAARVGGRPWDAVDGARACCSKPFSPPRPRLDLFPRRDAHTHIHLSPSSPQGAVWSCVLDAPALRAATASADFSARLWDAISGEELATFPHAHIVRTAAFAPGGDALVTGGYEKVVRVWDLGGPGPGSAAAAAEPRDAFTAPDKVRHATYTSDGGLLMTTYMDSPGVG